MILSISALMFVKNSLSSPHRRQLIARTACKTKVTGLNQWYSEFLHLYFPLSHAPLNLQPSPTTLPPFQPISPPHRSCWILQIAGSAVRLFSAFTNSRSFQQPYRPFTVCLRDPPPVSTLCSPLTLPLWKPPASASVTVHVPTPLFSCTVQPFATTTFSSVAPLKQPPHCINDRLPLGSETWFINVLETIVSQKTSQLLLCYHLAHFAKPHWIKHFVDSHEPFQKSVRILNKAVQVAD
jgi:hypothetical protein